MGVKGKHRLVGGVHLPEKEVGETNLGETFLWFRERGRGSG